MDTRSVLVTQIDNLSKQLLQVEQAVQLEQAVQSNRLDARLRNRVRARFDQLLSPQRTQLTDLRQQVSNNQPLQACWSQFRQLDLDCRSLFDECLAFIQGALARGDAVDEGMCLHADNLLDDLAYWAVVEWLRITILGTGELYRDTVEIIRVHFPEVSLWGLPLVSHEFGHFLGPELWENKNAGRKYPFQEMLDHADENRPQDWPLPHSTEWYHLQEHFADLFATYSLGPAFACSFILLRLNPVDAFQESLTHPSHANRVHSIFWMLDRMNQEGWLHPYSMLIDMLRNLWQQGLQDVGQTGSLSDAAIALLEFKLGKLHDLLTRTTPTLLAYRESDWQKSQIIATRLLSDTWSSGQNGGEVTRRDVLNAAWLSRLSLNSPNEYHVNVNDINLRALETYRHIPPRQF